MSSRKGGQHKKRRKKEGKILAGMNPLPEYLLQTSSPPASLPPPVQSRLQDLPFDQLPWDYFERLCKTLVEADHEIRACRLYGRPGQKQRGIDLLAYPKDFVTVQPSAISFSLLQE